MSITMQGSWTLRVKTHESAFAQRFVVSGATTGNGIYDGMVGNTVFVTGAQWSLTVQHRPTRQAWLDSAQRIGLPNLEAGLLRFEIAANDGGLDDDYDDLVLACSLPASQSDYVLYGAVTSHEAQGPFNPRRDDYIVIDRPRDLGSVCTRYPQLTELLRKLYPEQPLAAALGHDVTPLVIPTGLPNVAVGLVFLSRMVPGAEFDGAEADVVEALRTTVRRVPFKAAALKAGVSRLSLRDLESIARLRDEALRHGCDATPAPGVALRFQRYNRTAAELLDGPYSGRGLREELGLAVTDEQGHYIFRCRQEPAAALRPDVIVQVMGTAGEPSFETAPYDNVANLRRIDMCIPALQAQACPAGLSRSKLPALRGVVMPSAQALSNEHSKLIGQPHLRVQLAA